MTDLPTREPWTVLVVDDEPDIRAYLTRVLKQAIPSVRVVTASNGKEGLAALAQNPVDLIVSDQRMPEMDGVAFLALAAKSAPSVPRVLLTGFADVSVAMRAVNEGHISLFLQKPVRNADFAREALRLLEARTAEVQQRLAFARSIDAARKRTAPFSGPLHEEDR